MFISRLLWCTSSLHHHQKQTTIIIFGYTPFSNKLSSSSRIKKPSRRVKSSQVNSLLNSTNSCGLEFSSCSKSKHAKLQEKKSILMPIICHFILDLVSRFLLSKKWFLQTCHVRKESVGDPTQTRKENFIMVTACKRIQLLVILTNHRLFIWFCSEWHKKEGDSLLQLRLEQTKMDK